MRSLHYLSILFFVALFTTSCATMKNKGTNFSKKSPYHSKSGEKLSAKSYGQSERHHDDSLSSLGEINPESDTSMDENGCPKGENPLDAALELCELSQEYWQKGELENALDALDQAYNFIINVDTYDKPSLTQQKDDLRFMISKRILEIYASRNIVVTGSHDAIPLTINEHVQREIDLFTTGREKNFFAESYKRSGKYRPMIVAALQNAGLPEELSWLPLIESGFKVNALSPARALGLWQFIPSTGYKFGLKRDRYIDERLDFEKSTMAAIEYMKELHQMFGEWVTVLAAYNCGEGRVLRVIRSQNVNYLDNFWDLYMRLPRETARYVPRFLATLHIVKNPEKYGLDKIAVDQPLAYETATVNKKAHIKDIAGLLQISEEELKGLNPELRYNILPSDNYTLRVPFEKKEVLLASLENIPTYTPPTEYVAPSKPSPSQKKYRYHRVKGGETISSIAKRYGTDIKTIAANNKLNRKLTIVSGQTLKIPARFAETPSNAPADRSPASKTVQHVVKTGDSLWVLAKKYETTADNIKKLNSLSNANLHIGQTLKIATNNAGTESNSRLKYLVRHGDSPSIIAKRHKMSLGRFLKLNSLNSRSKIFPGQVCYVE